MLEELASMSPILDRSISTPLAAPFHTSTSRKTMSSREIAELTGKRHDNILVDIRKMLTDLFGEGGLLGFQDTYRHPQNGVLYEIFNLPKDLTITLVSGYNVQMRYAITKRWMELEEAAKPVALPTTYLAALEELVQSVKEKEALRLENEAMKPAATASSFPKPSAQMPGIPGI